MFKKTRLGLAVSAAFGVGLTGFAPHALAQAQAQPQQLDRVEVTGSLIKRLESETYQPVTTLKASDLEKAGVTNAEQALQFVTQNQAATTSTSSVSARRTAAPRSPTCAAWATVAHSCCWTESAWSTTRTTAGWHSRST